MSLIVSIILISPFSNFLISYGPDSLRSITLKDIPLLVTIFLILSEVYLFLGQPKATLSSLML